MFSTSMQVRSEETPRILVEYTARSLAVVQFRQAECHVSADLLKSVVMFHEINSGGAIHIQTDMLIHGLVLIWHNCAHDETQVYMQQALNGVVWRLRETCRDCPDFNPGLFNETDDDLAEPC